MCVINLKEARVVPNATVQKKLCIEQFLLFSEIGDDTPVVLEAPPFLFTFQPLTNAAS